jgi:hypothetical protein
VQEATQKVGARANQQDGQKVIGKGVEELFDGHTGLRQKQ